MNDVVFSPISLSLFEELIEKSVKNALASFNPIQLPATPQLDPDQRLYGDKAAATYLGCTPLTIAKLRQSGAITFYRFGRKYFYKSSELDRELKHEARRFGELRGRRAKDGN